ncbi:M55 family metallopeptidase [Acidisoma cellulosilytica]|uniref:M55 family metallopeptidase n=1 Tax=Acidisoma cellulosilyticum TaxID=2802395 RepID=A0A964E4Z9_9PROT|nr:M55 family metallopeptidase [Acidisoma cellulosilyticum]MCB8882180.1 M55 family metallopeptidase [Acidisoma cellulosilyticum]
MKIFISVDIEGVAGVVVPKQGQPGNLEYEHSRRLMTEEANAAIAGAFAGGATEVLVNDSHGPMINLIPDLLDDRAELIRGQIKPGSMFAGLDDSYAGAMCVGYHAAAADFGVLAHTYSTRDFSAVRLNGLPASEAMVFGAYAGAMAVPVILLSGDDVTARSCGALFPGAEVVTVKTALGQRAAKALSPQMARARIRDAAERAVQSATRIKPYTIAEPCALELDLTSAVLADLCETIPVARRHSALTVGFEAPSIGDAIRWMAVCCMLGSHLV